MQTQNRFVGIEVAAIVPGQDADLAKALARKLLRALTRSSYAYVLIGCCLGISSLSGAACLLLGVANLRRDPWYREWQLWMLLAVALLLQLGRL